MRQLWRHGAVLVGVLTTVGVFAAGLAARPAEGPTPHAAPTPGELPALPPPVDTTPPAAVTPVGYTEPAPRPDAAVVLEWAGPPVVTVGRPNPYTLAVKNTAAQPAQKVVVQVRAPAGTGIGTTSPEARVVDGVRVWELGTLAAGEVKPLKLDLTPSARGETGCQAWVTVTGTAAMKVRATAPALAIKIDAPKQVPVDTSFGATMTVTNVGDAPIERLDRVLLFEDQPATEAIPPVSLAVGDTVSIGFAYRADRPRVISIRGQAHATEPVTLRETTTAQVRVTGPELTATLTGPEKLMAGRPGTYTARITNTGDGVAHGVSLARFAPAGWKVNGPLPAATDIPPKGHVETTFTATPTTVGESEWHIRAAGKHCAADAKTHTLVDGVPALRVQLLDTVDPILLGAETVYEIRVTNTGSKADTNVVVNCPLPAQLKLVDTDGPTAATITSLPGCTVVRFAPVRTLAPQTEVVFRITATATGLGDIRVPVRITSDSLTSSVSNEESTRVYGK